MRDLSAHDAHTRNKLDRTFKFLGVEGIFILGLGLGWSLGLFSLNASLTTIPLFLLGIGGLTLLAAGAVFYWKSRLVPPQFYSRHPIDLRDSIRAHRIHGTLAPLIERPSVRTEMLCLSAKETLLLPENHKFIVEHWTGPEAELTLSNTVLSLSPEQILYFDSGQLQRWEKGKMRLAIVPIDIRADEDLVLLLHMIPQEV